MKIKIIERVKKTVDREIISEDIDNGYLHSVGIAVGKKLGEGMFGKVYEIATDLGSGMQSYALKYVDSNSPGYARERRQYQNVKKFVDSAKERDDKEAIKLSAFLPVIHSIGEHNGNLYIVMEKLLPLSDEEKKLFMSEVSGLAYYYSEKGQKSRGEQLVDYIIDRDGNIGIKFDSHMAAAYARAIMRGPEYNHLKRNPQQVADVILRGGNSENTQKIMNIWENSPGFDDIKHFAIKELYKLNKGFKKIMNGVSNILVNEYSNHEGNPDAGKPEKDPMFIGMLMSVVFNITFSQKYPMKYTDSDWSPVYDTGHGQSSEIYDLDIDANPKLKEMKVPSSFINPKLPSKAKPYPQKYLFDRFISTIRRLGRDWGVQAKDMHNSNVMKRANGQYVIADIGLFNVKQIQSFQSGIFESKRKIKVKIT